MIEFDLSKTPVVVLNWKGIEDTIKALESLLVQEMVSHVVLIDNDSDQNEKQRLRALSEANPRIDLIENPRNLGFGKAHNHVFRLLKQKGFEFVACLNNDAVADEFWIKELVNCAFERKASIVASLMVMESNKELVDTAGHQMLSTGEIIPRGQGEVTSNYSDYHEVIGACAGACLYDLKMLDKLGYFDERFFVGYEDAELGLRAWLCGYTCVYSPKAIVHHKMSTSIGRIRSTEYLSVIQSHIFYTWFKLMPLKIILVQFPAMVFKYSMVVVVDIVFLRFKFLKVMVVAILKTFRQFPQFSRARNDFYSNHNVERSFREINQSLIPFLAFDIKRFWSFVILKRKSALEK